MCSVAKSGIRNGKRSVTFTISSITEATLTYASGNNHDPEVDSNGTRIVVPRP
jgi:hypothetical protein